MQRPRINIAVTGLNAIDSPGPGVPVIRGLREAASFDARVTGLAYEAMEPGIYMDDIADQSYLIPYPSAGMEALRERIAFIHSREKLDVIIPNFDAELFSFMRLEPELRKMGIHMFLPTFDQFEERQKTNLPEFGKKHGLHVPEGKAVNSLNELSAAAQRMGYPLMVKGKFYDAYVAINPEQAVSFFSKIAAKWGYPVVVQKFIKGSEINMIGVGDGKGNTISAVAMRKQFITDKGKAWAGITITDPEFTALTRRFVSSTKWKGAFELEMMKAEDGKYYLMEINPRIPAWVYLAIASGHNIPEAIVNLALGNPVKPYPDADAGKMFIRYSWDMIVDRERFENLSVHGDLKNKV
jgi:carbamoyl-phosphate synthase large subunit